MRAGRASPSAARSFGDDRRRTDGSFHQLLVLSSIDPGDTRAAVALDDTEQNVSRPPYAGGRLRGGDAGNRTRVRSRVESGVYERSRRSNLALDSPAGG